MKEEKDETSLAEAKHYLDRVYEFIYIFATSMPLKGSWARSILGDQIEGLVKDYEPAHS